MPSQSRVTAAKLIDGPVATFCDTTFGGVERWHFDEPADADMRVPNELRQCVCFLCVKGIENGQERTFYGGTAFFVAVRTQDTEDHYLVTAKHCIERASAFGVLYARLNRTGGGAEIIALPDRWLFSENEASDIAVMPMSPDPAVFDHASLNVDMFASEAIIKDHDIGVGDDLFVVGLFTRRHGTQRNIPIVRTGVISSMPEEPFIDDAGREYHVYLAEIRSLGGLSGSPVFVYLAPMRQITLEKNTKRLAPLYFVLGCIRGHWDLRTESVIDFANDEDARLNTGIAAVTPIQAALDIIMSKDQVKARAAKERK